MHISRTVLIILIIFISCKKETQETQENNNVASIDSLSEKPQNNVEDSLVNNKLIEQKKSIMWENQNRDFHKSTILLNLNDFYQMTKMNPLEIEDFLIVNNWNIISKRVVEEMKPKRKGKVTVEEIINRTEIGTHLTFRNDFNDSEIKIFLDKNNNLQVDLKTVNVFNYRKLTTLITNENFAVRDGGAHENPYVYLGHKTAIGILEPIKSNIKIYKKANFEISSIIATFSPVTFVPEEENLSFENNGFKYDSSIEYNLYHFTFERESE